MSTYYLKSRAGGAQSQPRYTLNISSSSEEDQTKSIYKEALEKSLTLKRSQDPLEHSKVNLSRETVKSGYIYEEKENKRPTRSYMGSPMRQIQVLRGSKLENLRDKYLSQNSAIKELKESERSKRTDQNSQRPINPFAIYKEIKAARRLEVLRVNSQKRTRSNQKSRSKPKAKKSSKKMKKQSTLFSRMKEQKINMNTRMTKRRPVNATKTLNTTLSNIPSNLIFKNTSKKQPLKPTNNSFLTKNTQATSTTVQTRPKNPDLTTKAPTRGLLSSSFYNRKRKSSQPDLSRGHNKNYSFSKPMHTSAFKSKRMSMNGSISGIRTSKKPSFTDFNPKKVLNISIDKSSQDVSVSGIHFLTINSDTQNYNSLKPNTPSSSENCLSVQTKKFKNSKNFEIEDLVDLQQKVILHLLGKDKGFRQKPDDDIARFIDQISKERGVINQRMRTKN